MDISGLLKVLRTAAGLKQFELAARAGISQNYLSMIESGRRQPSAGVLERLSAGLNVPAALFAMYRSGIPDGLSSKERELVERLRQLCVDFLKVKLGLEV
jgi:transcriptional regulator with XRE-family HTH domain